MLKHLVAVVLALAMLAGISVPAAAAQQPSLISETAVLMDAQTGQILFEKDMDRQMYPASITKIMTALLAIELGDLDDIVTMSYEATHSIEPNSSHIALDTDEQISLRDLMYALMLPSANDAANGIAEHIGGSMEAFVDLMNQRAQELGCTGTHFVNAHGLHDDDHYTTAHDMALIMQEALKHPEFVEIASTAHYEIQPTNKQPDVRYLHNQHYMLYGSDPYEGAIAGKTGWTQDAKHTLVTAATRGDRTLIAVVMKSTQADDKFIDTSALLDYGFDNFQKITVTPEEVQIPPQTFWEGGIEYEATFSITEDITYLLQEDIDPADVKIEPVIAEDLGSDDLMQARLEISLPDGSFKMYPQIASVSLRPDVVDLTALAQVQAEKDRLEWERTHGTPLWKVILIILGCVLGSGIVTLFAIRAINLHRRKKRKLERMRRARTYREPDYESIRKLVRPARGQPRLSHEREF